MMPVRSVSAGWGKPSGGASEAAGSWSGVVDSSLMDPIVPN